jgi:hypothetical protein
VDVVTATAYERILDRPQQMVDHALELAGCAWEVFPCWEYNYKVDPKTGEPEGAKAPRTAHGHLDATMDPDVIKAWWQRWPDAMIGAAVPALLLVIDIDPRNGGSLQALTKLVGALPETLTAWSGRNDGGCHLYFLRPPGPLTSTKMPAGIDLKVNGYMIMPPSIHPQPASRTDGRTIPLRHCHPGRGCCYAPHPNPSKPSPAPRRTVPG